MSPLQNLMFLVILAGVVFIIYRFRLQRIEEALLDNPPERRAIEVSLPIGATNSGKEMARFYRKVSSSALGDKKARQKGVRQIDFVYLVDVQAEGAEPRLRCRIYSDPDQMDLIKKALKGSFTDWVDIVEIQEDELQMLAAELRPPETESEDPAEADPDSPLLEEGRG